MQSINILDPIYNNPATRSAEGKEIGIFFYEKAVRNLWWKAVTHRLAENV